MWKVIEFLGITAVIALTVAIPPILFMFCFNLVAPAFYPNAPELGFVQALAFVVGVRILLGKNPFGIKDEQAQRQE